jgi:hypothetical protein
MLQILYTLHMSNNFKSKTAEYCNILQLSFEGNINFNARKLWLAVFFLYQILKFPPEYLVLVCFYNSSLYFYRDGFLKYRGFLISLLFKYSNPFLNIFSFLVKLRSQIKCFLFKYRSVAIFTNT